MLRSVLRDAAAVVRGRTTRRTADAPAEPGGLFIRFDYPYRAEARPPFSAVRDIIGTGDSSYAEFLRHLTPLAPQLRRISRHPSGLSPGWQNGWIPPLDAMTLYGMLAIHNPRRYVEIGSGNSTMFARQAIMDYGLRTRIISIDPQPRADIDRICDMVIRQRCEDTREPFDTMSADDVLFVDNSHRSFPNSDVTVFFLEILPQLPSGTIYGLHDIFLPNDYPSQWCGRYYNEQYLLASYLLGGARGDSIVSPNAYMSSEHFRSLGILDEIFASENLRGCERSGAAFWMRRA